MREAIACVALGVALMLGAFAVGCGGSRVVVATDDGGALDSGIVATDDGGALDSGIVATDGAVACVASAQWLGPLWVPYCSGSAGALAIVVQVSGVPAPTQRIIYGPDWPSIKATIETAGIYNGIANSAANAQATADAVCSASKVCAP